MKDVIIDTKAKIEELKESLKAHEDLLASLQKVCKHHHEDDSSAFHSIGFDSHYEYFECDICGLKWKK